MSEAMAGLTSTDGSHGAAAARRRSIGVILPAAGRWADVRDLAHLAEELGVESVWVPEGFSGRSSEAWTILSAVAASVERLELGVYMLNASLRDLALLARMTATLERVAPGRVRILLGTGWDRSDYEALGADFPGPDARVERTRRAVELLTERTNASVEIAGVTDDLVHLAAERAHGWALSGEALDVFFQRVGFLRDACAETGRVFGDLRISCTLPSVEDVARVHDLEEHGMHEFLVKLPGAPTSRDHLERVVLELTRSSR